MAHPLFCNLGSLTLRLLQLTVLLSTRRLMSYWPVVQLNYLLFMLAFILIPWGYIRIWVVYDPYSFLDDSISICIYLHLGCLLPDRYGNLFKKFIMFSLLISRILIPIVKHHCHSFYFVWKNKPNQLKVSPFGLTTAS